MSIAFIGIEEWEKSAYPVQKEAEKLIDADFGDRAMIWSEMAEVLKTKGVPSEHIHGYCVRALGGLQSLLDLFGVEIEESLRPDKKESPQAATKDHRILNPDIPERRAEIRELLLGAWKD